MVHARAHTHIRTYIRAPRLRAAKRGLRRIAIVCFNAEVFGKRAGVENRRGELGNGEKRREEEVGAGPAGGKGIEERMKRAGSP